MEIPYLKELQTCRNYLEYYFSSNDFENTLGLARFPDGKCQYASKLVAKVLSIEEVAGYYTGFSDRMWHAWNYDPLRELYVDISLDQFDTVHPSIAILPRNNPFLKRINIETRNHIRSSGLYSLPHISSVFDNYDLYKKRELIK